MKFDLKKLKDKANQALKDSGADKLIAQAQEKAAEAKDKLAPLAKQVADKVAEADKALNEQADKAVKKVGDAIKKHTDPK